MVPSPLPKTLTQDKKEYAKAQEATSLLYAKNQKPKTKAQEAKTKRGQKCSKSSFYSFQEVL